MKKNFLTRHLKTTFDSLKFVFVSKCTGSPPHWVKRKVFSNHALNNATWIETGTYIGDSTKYFAENYNFVHTIEPSGSCLAFAKKRLSKYKNISFYNQESQQCMDRICKSLSGNVNFWLDGHFSGGDTFEGCSYCPLKEELSQIEKNMHSLDDVVIFIDDV